MVTNNPQVLEELSREYEHQDKPVVDLGLKPLWSDDRQKASVTTTKSNGKNEPFIEQV